MKRSSLFLLLIFGNQLLFSQIDPELLRNPPKDTTAGYLNMDANYSRPGLNTNKLPVTLGGYLEANYQKSVTDGLSEGHQFQFRRFTIFMAATLAKRIKFLSEIEFEDGTKEIAIEFAAVDIEFHSMLNLRGGIITNPIGSFNQNHDGPKWEFIDRPISSTLLLPATFSNAGFGLYGKNYSGAWKMGYEVYLTNGFNNSIIENEENKTFLPAVKNDPFRFEESFNGRPLLTAKLAVRHDYTGEIGISYMGGVYNRSVDDGLVIDEKRRCDVFAIDYKHTIPVLGTSVTAEWAWLFIDIPVTYTEQFGSRQYGGFIDIVQPLLKRGILGWDDAILNAACRLEYTDWNKGTFQGKRDNIGEDTWSIMPAISFRPTGQTVFRMNYRYQETRDIFGNPPEITAIFSVGLSTYF